MIRVSAGSIIAPALRRSLYVEPGLRLTEIVARAQIPPRFLSSLEVAVDGETIPPDWWHRVKPRDDRVVTISLVPQNFPMDSDMRGLLGAAIQVAGLGIGVGVSMIAGVPLAYAVGVGGLLGTWAATLLPPPTDTLDDKSPASGAPGNQIRKYEAVPRVYGEYRVFPPFAAVPVHEIDNNEDYVRLLFCLGYGPLRAYDFKFGDKPLPSDRRGAFEIQYHTGWHNSPKFDLYTNDIDVENLDKEIAYAEAWTNTDSRAVRPPVHENVIALVTPDKTTEISLDFIFPDGLYSAGGDSGYRVDVEVRYRPKGSTGDWLYVPDPDGDDYDVHSFDSWTDSQWFAALESINDSLDTAIAALNAIAVGSRIISSTLASFTRRQIGAAGAAIAARLAETDITSTERTDAEAAQTKLGSLVALLDSATETATELAEGVSSFNDTLSDALTLIEFLDQFHQAQQCVDAGAGPDLSHFGVIQRLYLNIFHNTDIFGEPGSNAFVLATEDNKNETVRRNVHFPVQEGKYEVQVRRVSKETTKDDVSDTVHIREARFTRAAAALSAKALERCAFIAMRVKLSEVDGNFEQFNCMVQTPLEWYDGAAWQGPALTDTDGAPVYCNPAWIFCDILRGNAARYPLTDDTRLDLTRIQEWAAYCEENEYYFNGEFARRTTPGKVLQDVCRVGMASHIDRWGAHSVIVDWPQTTSTAIITERVSRDFVVSKTLGSRVQCLRARFKNEEKGFADDELAVYDDGYDISNPPKRTDELDLFGVTDPALVYKTCRRLIASAKLRPETFQFSLGLKSLAFERGDRISIVHDVTMWGKGSARIRTAVLSAGLYRVTLDDDVTQWDWTGGNPVRVWTSAGDVIEGAGVLDGTTVVVTPTAGHDWSAAAAGNLFAVGQPTDVVVKEIQRDSKLGARVVAVEYNEGVYASETEAIPEFSSNITQPYSRALAIPPRPEIIECRTDDVAANKRTDGTFDTRILLYLRIPAGATDIEREAAARINAIEVQWRDSLGAGASHSGYGRRPWTGRQIVKRDLTHVYIQPVRYGRHYDVRVRTVTDAGVTSEWMTVWNLLIAGIEGPPPDVTDLKISGGNVLTWSYNRPLDHAGFLVRFYQGIGGTWESAVPAHDGLLGESRFSLDDIRGPYYTLFVKARDTSGNESLNAASLDVEGSVGLQANVAKHYNFPSSYAWNASAATCSNMTINGSNELVADAGTPDLFHGEDGSLFHLAGGGLFHGADYLDSWFEYAVSYSDPFPSIFYPGIRLLVSDIDAEGDNWKVEFRDPFAQLWPDDLNADLWPDVKADLWPKYTNYEMFPGSRSMKTDVVTGLLRFSSCRSNVQFKLKSLRITIDYP